MSKTKSDLKYYLNVSFGWFISTILKDDMLWMQGSTIIYFFSPIIAQPKIVSRNYRCGPYKKNKKCFSAHPHKYALIKL